MHVYKNILGFYMPLSLGTKAIIFTGSLALTSVIDFVMYYKKVKKR